MSLLLGGCTGFVDVDVFFFDDPPIRDGTHLLAFDIYEDDRVIAYDAVPFTDRPPDLQLTIPFGLERSVVGKLVDGDGAIIMAGESLIFSVDENSRTSVNVSLRDVPLRPEPLIVEARNGRISSEMVTMELAHVGGTTVEIAEDANWPGTAFEVPFGTNIGDLVRATVTIDPTCSVGAGCRKTLFVRSYFTERHPSPEASVDVIIDAVAPSLTSVETRLEAEPLLPNRAVQAIGEPVRVHFLMDFDEDLGEPPLAVLRRVDGDCASTVQTLCTGGLVVECETEGLAFGQDCEGTYLLEVVAVDLATNISSSQSVMLDTPVDLAPPPRPLMGAMTSSCAGDQSLLIGGNNAVSPNGIVSVGGIRGPADAAGRFVMPASGLVVVRQIDDAGNESASISVEVPPCDG